MRITSPWTDEQVNELKVLWEQGISANAIAKKMGFNSKNPILGKAFRLNLPSRQSLKRKDAHNKKPFETVSFFTPLLKTCAWPIGHPDKANFHYCGGDIVKGKPYCAAHCKIAYRVREVA
jgi:GcrA cell cycle regulator|tara:strand:- start:451 stop:810 length:360 start_codon:yes stop_codon:yes gene_type:complete